MSTSRWDPWGESDNLREAMSDLLEENFLRGGGLLGLTVDLRETPGQFVLTVSVPGVSPEDVHISVVGDSVRISGERRDVSREQTTSDDGRWLIRERHFGPFERTIKLTAAVDIDQSSASFEHGVLTVMMPKAATAVPRRIPVRPANGPTPIDVT